MLLSDNAVHSALFLIVTMGCIAFLFLLLNAPFLAMIQITVYTGAIMVLFLFVIMLLGSERCRTMRRPRVDRASAGTRLLAVGWSLALLLIVGIVARSGQPRSAMPTPARRRSCASSTPRRTPGRSTCSPTIS